MRGVFFFFSVMGVRINTWRLVVEQFVVKRKMSLSRCGPAKYPERIRKEQNTLV